MNTWLFRFVQWFTFLSLALSSHVLVPVLAQQQALLSQPVVADGDPASDPTLATPADKATEPVVLNQEQGTVTLEVQVNPSNVKAGEDITYTYLYKNTSTTETFTDLLLEVVWVDFAPTYNKTVWQYCQSSCDVKGGSVQGPSVSLKEEVNNSGRGWFRINGALEPGESGQFSVVLSTTDHAFPRTNETIVRPSGTGRLFESDGNTLISEDTQNAMVISPVFVLEKEPTNSSAFPGESVEFTISLGNATGSGDSPGGEIRADAIAANGIVVEDTFPAGSDFFSSTPSPSKVDNANGKVTWNINALSSGQTTSIKVRYKKLDEAVDCGKMQNTTYTVTSAEMPMQKDSSTRHTVAGEASSVTINPTVNLKSVTASPSSIPFGDTSTIAIVVDNAYNKSAGGVKLEYTLPDNVSFQSASDSGSHSGGTVTWNNVTIPQGSKTFEVVVSGDGAEKGSTGTATLTVPSSTPSACSTKSMSGGAVTLTPRLTIIKDRSSDMLVKSGEEIPYTVTIKNVSKNTITGLSITDELPGEPDKSACFTYVANSSSHGEPTKTGGGCGTLTWADLSIPPGGTLNLNYKLKAAGFDYNTYCNVASAQISGETASYTVKEPACVHINPALELQKSVNTATADQGQTVRFTLSLTNRENETYRVGLHDELGEFEFVGQVSGYMSHTLEAGNKLTWPMVDLAPGNTIEAVFDAKISANCPKGDPYENEGFFFVRSLGEEYKVLPITPVIAKVKYNPGSGCAAPTATPTPTPSGPGPTATPTPTVVPVYDLEYTKTANRTEASLKDDVIYTITIQNLTNTGETVRNVRVVDVLPEQFDFTAMEATSGVTVTPRLEPNEDLQMQLLWTISAIEPNETVTIKYRAVSGEIVGTYRGSMTLEVDDPWVPVAEGDVTTPITVKPLVTMVLAMDYHKQSGKDCATQGTPIGYEVKLVSTNIRAYDDIDVTVRLPVGLKYVGMQPGDSIPDPKITTDGAGVTMLSWNDLYIPKPEGAKFAQIVLPIDLELGHVWGTLEPIVDATTALEGSIPIRDSEDVGDDVGDPLETTVTVCDPTKPTIGKEVDLDKVVVGSTMFYQVTLVNTNDKPITNVSLQDVLPEHVEYVKMVGQSMPIPTTETLDDNKTRLTWDGLTVPAPQGDDTIGVKILNYQAQLTEGDIGEEFENKATITAPGDTFQPDNSSAVVTVVDPDVIIFPGDTPHLYTSILNVSDDVCEDQGKELTYRVSLLNSNIDKSYANTALSVKLPVGLEYQDILYTNLPESLQKPLQKSNGDGSITLRWDGLTIPKAKGDVPSQVVLLLKLKIGDVWGTLKPTASAVSTDGVIQTLPNDEADTSQVTVCTPENALAMAKVVDTAQVFKGSTMVYQVSLSNTTGEDVSGVKVVDVLPDNVELVKVIGDTPQPELKDHPDTGTPKKRLVWNDVTVPAGVDEDTAGMLLLRYQARLNSGKVGETYTNSASVTADDTFVPDSDTAAIEMIEPPQPPQDVPYLIEDMPNSSSTECVEQGDTQTYRVTLFNPPKTERAYRDIDVTVALPVGLQYVETLSSSDPVLVETSGDGVTNLYWNDVLLPQAQGEEPATTTIEIRLQIGQTWGELEPIATAAWSEGTLRSFSDGETNTTLEICPPPAPTIGKEADNDKVVVESQVLYQITLVNTTPKDITGVMVEDVLPDEVEFVEMVDNGPYPNLRPDPETGEPDRYLIWNDLVVPAPEAGESVGMYQLRYLVQLKPGTVGESYENTATVTALEPFDPETSSTTIQVIESPNDGYGYLYTSLTGVSTTACQEQGKEFTYQLRLYNTNTVRDFHTRIVVKLPFGLKYLGVNADGMSAPVQAPEVVPNIDGSLWLVWKDVTLPMLAEKTPETILIPLKLQLGNVWESLTPVVSATSDDGEIILMPDAQGDINPEIAICLPPDNTTAIGKEVSHTRAVSGSLMIYRITLINTKETVVKDFQLHDVLPPDSKFIAMDEQGPQPLIQTDPITTELKQTLIWDTLTIPSKTANNAVGMTVLQYKVRVRGEIGTVLTNRIQAMPSDGFNPSQSESTVTIVGEDELTPPGGTEEDGEGPPFFTKLPFITHQPRNPF